MLRTVYYYSYKTSATFQFSYACLCQLNVCLYTCS